MEVEDQGRGTDVALINSISERVNASKRRLENKEPFKIFRVPARYREANKTIYEPRFVSIGPYYRGSQRLRTMEQNKWRYLDKLLSRPNPRKPVDDYVRKLRELEAQARSCYVDNFILNDDEFVVMLLLDGCFIIELVLMSWTDESDAMEHANWTIASTKSDLNLMENQIPFFVLDALFHLVMGPNATPNLIDLVGKFFGYGDSTQSITVVSHLLHLLHSCVVSKQELGKFAGGGVRVSNAIVWVISPLNYHRSATSTIPCATELQEAGVRFKRKMTDKVLDITFRNGTIEIPLIYFDQTSKCLIMNLVGFEQCTDLKEKHMAAFTYFMDCIINTAGDVAILEECGVLEHILGSREEVALFVNRLGECIYMDTKNHYLARLFRDVNQYCDSSWPKYRAKLKHEYFSSPWAILSLTAALILLALTFLQTFFAIYAYYRPPS